MTAPTHRYIHAATPHDDELGRLRLLEARYDELTRRRLAVAGSLVGARCLEVGAGAGSVAQMLSDAVGNTGEVVATDLDPRFLHDLDRANVTVRQHDIERDNEEIDAYDLVHCRALLLHLSDPQGALRRMAAALRPGGWLLVEDADFSSFASGAPGHPLAELFDRVSSAISSRLPRHLDPYFGARLPALVDSLGLERRGDEALEFRREGGSREAELFMLSWHLTRDRIPVDDVVTGAEFDLALGALSDPEFAFVDSRAVACWGRRPYPAYLG